MTVVEKANAKINLTLDVLGRYDNGYHELKMIMQSITLHDEVRLKSIDEDDIILNCNKNIVEIKENIVYKACELMKDRFNIDKGVEITLEKNIFVAAGLAGGSTDCAATIRGFNRLFNLGLTKREMMDIGSELGKDVVYCINGGLCIATGDGTDLEEIDRYSRTVVLVANPGFEVSTKEIFESYKFNEHEKSDYNKILLAIREDNKKEICNCFNNMLENVTIKKYPVIGEIKNSIIENDAIGALMSGSGATVFGFFDNENVAKKAEIHLKEKYKDILTRICYTI